MTETEVKLNELQQSITHLTGISEDGWVLKWGESPETSFELVCRKANALQVENIDNLISRAHQKAVTGLK
jgi:hypothetical protein